MSDPAPSAQSAVAPTPDDVVKRGGLCTQWLDGWDQCSRAATRAVTVEEGDRSVVRYEMCTLHANRFPLDAHIAALESTEERP